MLNGLDLFSGIGGLGMALEPWVRPVAYCENYKHAQAVILSRMREGTLSRAPIWDDVTTLSKDALGDVEIDIIYGGFPCQDISVAGRGAGLEGKRSGLFLEIIRLVGELQPTFVFLENVPAIRTRGAERVAKELAGHGYDCRWDVVSAQEVGAPHLRKRWFLLAAHTERIKRWDELRGRGRQSGQDTPEPRDDGEKESLANSDSIPKDLRQAEKRKSDLFASRASNAQSLGNASSEGLSHGPDITLGRREALKEFERPNWWSVEPDVGRVAHGIPMRVDRLRGLGNAVVPAQAREAFKRLAGL